MTAVTWTSPVTNRLLLEASAVRRGERFIVIKPPVGDAYIRLESARGDMGWYCVSDGSEYPYRVKIRTGSFTGTSILDHVSRGLMIADLVAVIASLDLVAPEIDR